MHTRIVFSVFSVYRHDLDRLDPGFLSPIEGPRRTPDNGAFQMRSGELFELFLLTKVNNRGLLIKSRIEMYR